MFTNEEILKITAAKSFEKAECVTGVSTDSRNILKGDLFVALRGDNFDGHKFAGKVIEKGAAAILSDHKIDVNVPQYIVGNTLTAYQQLARYHRLKMNVPVIGITGTNGKTTVKEMINSILSDVANPLCSEANFNNHIGVPVTLLKLKKEHTQAIVEMGMNHPGEIKVLSEIALPDVAVITSIGRGHIEFLGSVEKVLEAKTEILDGLNKNGTIILPLNSKFYDRMKSSAVNAGIKNIISFGDSDEADFSFIAEMSDETGSEGILKTP
ncbi:UDP-N-acetylmuramoyl-tripeptide--D-alanyl-D-alanine ligase, partial [bacterium]|nr:UDP-N-acetylmuramoyl-tripeptide--D-alanyl-D-alanine ligase [bacterium]